jgi:hypothetical protein
MTVVNSCKSISKIFSLLLECKRKELVSSTKVFSIVLDNVGTVFERAILALDT